MNMEIERKFLVRNVPENLTSYPHAELEQAYLSVNPVVRIRKEDEQYCLTYKGPGKMVREEYNLPLTEASYRHLMEKADGRVIRKTRYRIPLTPYTVELDAFHDDYEGLILAEIEFPSVEEALAFQMPDWFSEDVTEDRRYHNAAMALSPLPLC